MKFELSYPTDFYLVRQTFGEHPEFYADPKYGGIKGHNGLDSFSGHGTPVYATHDGLAECQVDDSGGHGVIIVTDKEYEYKGTQAYFKTIYWHLCDGDKEPQYRSPLEGKGKVKVSTGDLIGYADNTGASTGDHLHFGLKPMKKNLNGDFYNIEQNNGYLGAIDPNPYFNGTYPQTIKGLKKTILTLTTIVNYLKSLLSRK